MATIGFLANNTPAPQLVIPDTFADSMVRFDSGASIRFPDAVFNTLVLGSTGSGKTSSVILPAASSLIKAGFAGAVIDVKGNLASQIRALAAQHGRESDVVEFGMSPSATPVNLLSGMTGSAIYAFFRKLANNVSSESDHNRAWHETGIKQALDAFLLLRFLEKDMAEHGLYADLCGVKEVINDQLAATELYELFCKKAHSAGRDAIELKLRVQADAYHIFGDEERRSEEHFLQQTTWRLYVIRNVLDQLAETGLMSKFSAPGASGINMDDLVYLKGKIVVVSFDTTAGNIAGAVSRTIIEDYYRAVLKNGLSLPKEKYTFLLADEFPDCADLSSSSALNDNAFTSKAREFRSIQIFAAQSISGFLNRGARPAGMDEFLNNCNNKLFFYSDDELTQRSAEKFGRVTLYGMRPGECFTVRYDSCERTHVKGRETLQEAHDATNALLPSPGDDDASASPPLHEEVEERTPLYEILKKYAASRAGHNDSIDWAEFQAKKAELPAHVAELVERNVQFFDTEKIEDIDLPIGLVKHVEGIFKKIGMMKPGRKALKINSFRFERGIRASGTGSYLDDFNVLAMLIRACHMCGKNTSGDVLESPIFCAKCGGAEYIKKSAVPFGG